MNLLFVTQYPYSFNLNGAAAFSSSHLRNIAQLHSKEVKLHVLYLNEGKRFWLNDPDFDREQIVLHYGNNPKFQYKRISIKLLLNLIPVFQTTFEYKLAYIFDINNVSNFARKLEKIIDDYRIDIVWAEHMEAASILSLVQRRVKKIYAHHDFLYKLITIRRKKIKDYIRSYVLKQFEMQLLLQVDHIVSGSLSEIEICNRMTRSNSHLHLPCLYPLEKSNTINKQYNRNKKIIHFGSAQATANRVGLKFFFQNIYPFLDNREMEVHFIGKVKKYVLEELNISRSDNLIFHEYVLDVSTVISPMDVVVVPYDQLSGTRTRIGFLTKYQPLLLVFENALDSYPFLVDECNAFVVNSKEEFVKRIKQLLDSKKNWHHMSSNLISDFTTFEKVKLATLMEFLKL